MSFGTVLVVDDDRAISQLLAMTLEDAGYTVLRACHGEEALERLAESPADAIVLDLAMPVMDGETFYRHLRAHEREEVRDIPVLIVSAVGASRARQELGAEGAMEKPVDPDDLVDELGHLLRIHRTHTASRARAENVPAG